MTWTVLTFGYQSVLTSTKMTQLFDNLTALANGDSGAPPVLRAALEKPGAGDVQQMAACTSTDLSVPAVFPAALGGSTTATGTGYQSVTLQPSSVGSTGLTIRIAGEYRIHTRIQRTAGGALCTARPYVNGVAVGSQISSSGSLATADLDITLAAGDVVTFYVDRPSTASAIAGLYLRGGFSFGAVASHNI